MVGLLRRLDCGEMISEMEKGEISFTVQVVQKLRITI